MLQQLVPAAAPGGKARWASSSCATDQDEYNALMQTSPALADFQPGEKVWLLCPDLDHTLRNESRAPYCRELVFRDAWQADDSDKTMEAYVVADVLRRHDRSMEDPGRKGQDVEHKGIQFQLHRRDIPMTDT